MVMFETISKLRFKSVYQPLSESMDQLIPPSAQLRWEFREETRGVGTSYRKYLAAHNQIFRTLSGVVRVEELTLLSHLGFFCSSSKLHLLDRRVS